MSVLPIGLECTGLTAVVVGGGLVATRRALSLRECGAFVRVVAPEISTILRDAAERDTGLELHERDFGDDDVGEAALIVAAADSPGVNARVAAAARAAGALVNRADDPRQSTIHFLAVHRAGALAVGVSAGGVPRAAALIRDAIAQRFDSRYAVAVERLASLREGSDWIRASESLLGPDFCEGVESGELDRRIDAWH